MLGLLAGCAPASALPSAALLPPTETQSPSPTVTTTQSPTVTSTSTVTATATPTLTVTSTATITQTPTVMLTPTPHLVYNQPGSYDFNLCYYQSWGVSGGEDRYYKFCVVRVIVLADNTMKFYVSWELNLSFGATKRSDANNPNMYITDNLGNHYAFIAAGDGASETI